LHRPTLSDFEAAVARTVTPTPVCLTGIFFSMLYVIMIRESSPACLTSSRIPLIICRPVGLGSTASVFARHTGSAPTESASIKATLAVNRPTVYPLTLTLSNGFGPIPPQESQLTAMISLPSLNRRTSLAVLMRLGAREVPVKA
jgi:hypothetical protein